MTDVNEAYQALSVTKKKTVQEMRKRMAKDLGISVKEKIPIDLYIKIAQSKPMSEIEVEGKTHTVTFSMRSRATIILETLNIKLE